MKHPFAFCLLLSLVSSILPAQAPSDAKANEGIEPAKLALKGDPAMDLDLGSLRTASMPTRAVDGGPITSAPYFCVTSIRGGQQTIDPKAKVGPNQLLGRAPASVKPWLRNLSKKKHHVIYTPRWTLVAYLDGKKAPPLIPTEAVRLSAWFPKLGMKPSKLTGLQRAHLYALRMFEAESAIADLIELDERFELKPVAGGYQPLPHRSVEIYLFDDPKAYDAFRIHLFKPETAEVRSEVLPGGPVVALLMQDGTQQDQLRRFANAASTALLQRYRRKEGGPPPWVRLGIGHYLEIKSASVRRFKKRQGRDGSRTLPGLKKPLRTSWDQVVKDTISEGKSGEFGALSATPNRGMTPPVELQAYTVVRYLMGVSPKRFGAMMRELYHAHPSVNSSEAVAEALRKTYGHEPQAIEAAWKKWCLKTGGL